jgi:SagB-type dehydrogenase family enzyme
MTSSLSAAGLAAATVDDPQFRLPEHPSVVPGVVLRWLGEELVVEGTGNRRVITGRTARRLLPDLLPLLDGRRSVTDLGTALGQPPARIRSVLLLLFSCGLLQEGPGAVGKARTPQAVLLSRLLDTTRVNANVDEAQSRLATAQVGLAAGDAFTAGLAADLRGMGMQVHRLGSGHDDGTADRLDLAVVWVDEETRADRAVLCRGLRDAGTPVLLVGPAGSSFVLGPYSAGDYGACPDCYLAQTDRAVGSATGAEVRGFAALTAVEVAALVSRVGTAASLRGRTVLGLRSGRPQAEYLAPRPGCPTCGDPAVELQDPPIAYRYETSVAFPPRRLVNPRDHQHHFESSNVALQFDFPAFRGTSHTELPGTGLTGAADDEARPGGEGAVSLTQLGTLLQVAFGLKERPGPGKLLRWAPTGGNLGSPTCYVVVRDVDGLPPGVYGYQPNGHHLVLVRDRLPETLGVGAPVTLVVGGALLRVARKYRTFAYRVIHLDTGVALSHVVLLARRLGLQATNHPAWDDLRIADEVGADPDGEAVTAVLTLRPTTTDRDVTA